MSVAQGLKTAGYAIPQQLLKPAPRLTRLRPRTLGCGTVIGWFILIPSTLLYLYIVVTTAMDAWAKYQGRLPGVSWAKVFDSLGIGGGFLLVFVLPLFYVCCIHYWLEKRLCRWGTPVKGTITQRKLHRGRSGMSYYELHYEFEHPKLGKSKSHVYVAAALWEKATEGETVTILCDPDRGEHSSVIYEYGYFECL